MKLNAYLAKSTAVAALGGLMFGFDTAVISGAIGTLRQTYQLSPEVIGITVDSAVLGAIFGALLAAIPGERFGRRDSLKIMAVLYLTSAIGCAFAWNWYALIVFRFIGGLGIGGSSVLSAMYLAEIAPPDLRGRLVGFFQFNIVFGILVAYLSNYLITLQEFGLAEWRWELGVTALPAALFFVTLFGIPRSPRWLVKKNRIEEARKILQLTGEHDYEHELQEIVQSIHVEQEQAAEKLFSRRYLLPIFLAVTVGMFNQLSGINAVLYYLNDIFAYAGFSRASSSLQAVAVGGTNLLFTILAMSVIDKIGRKILLLVGAVAMALCLAGVSVIFFSGSHQNLLVWLLIGFIASFAFSQGAVIWVYLGEVFPNNVRAKGQSLGSFSHWFMNGLISVCFPLMAASSGGYPFAFFAAMMVLQFFVVLLVYPETKGLSLEEMQKKMGIV
ncbi:MAG TPA: sugar porter family MFS transporter [Terriglobales bacterium]|nr:sugar porter family MFS transporter [Terriglobales bacterium]